MFQRLRKESRDLIKHVIELVYFMRGAIQYESMMEMTPGERDMIAEFIKVRLEDQKGNPYKVY